MRITDKQLQKVVDLLNETCGLPLETYRQNRDGSYVQPLESTGNFQLDHAYGRVALTQNAQSVRVIDGTTKWDLFDKIHILIKGIEYGKRMSMVKER